MTMIAPDQSTHLFKGNLLDQYIDRSDKHYSSANI